MAPKKKPSDFRYSTGDTKVPWHAVGEPYRVGDVLDVVRFLLPAKEGAKNYKARLAGVRAALQKLTPEAGVATKLTLGGQVARAEELARNFLKVKHACFLTNWTAGMEISFKLAGLRPGDEVIVPSITFIATMAYPLSIGAKVVFADVDPATVNMDPADVARKITPRTRVIVPVHIGGYPCDMDPIMKLAKKHDIMVMEDAAHGFGATYKGRFLGTIGHFGGYSFHEVKNINAFGEGGLLVSNDKLGEQFAKARFLGLDFSRTIPDWLYDIAALEDRFGKPQVPGNSSVTELQALGFELQLKRLNRILSTRRKHAEYLSAAFAKVPGILPPPPEAQGTRSSWHLYLLRIDPKVVGGDIQALKRKLKEKGVTEIAHFGPMYRFDILHRLGYKADAIARTCPNTERVFHREYTHLPLYPLTTGQLKYMAKAVADAVCELRNGR